MAVTATRRNLLLLMILLVLYEVKYWRHSATKLLTESLNGYCTFKDVLIRSVCFIVYTWGFACILKLQHSSAKSIAAGYKVLPHLPQLGTGLLTCNIIEEPVPFYSVYLLPTFPGPRYWPHSMFKCCEESCVARRIHRYC